AQFLARGVLPAKRRVALVAAAVVVVGGAAGGGVALATGGGNGSTASPPAGGGSLGTAPVMRTDLANTVQVGGSIGYDGSYAVAAPSGNPAQITQAQQAVTQDRQALSAATRIESDTSA